MKVFIIVESDRFFMPKTLLDIVSGAKEDIVGVGIARFPYKGKKAIRQKLKRLRREIALFGVIGIGKAGLLLTGRRIKNLFKAPPNRFLNDVSSMVNYLNLPLYELRGVNSKKSLSLLKSIKPDIIISLQDQIFRDKILSLPRIGCINKHAGLLPKYRGVWPIFWALKDNAKEVGITIHWMNSEIDAGGILVQKPLKVLKHDTLFFLYEKVLNLCAPAVLEALDMIRNGALPERESGEISESYYSYPTSRDRRVLLQSGRKIV